MRQWRGAITVIVLAWMGRPWRIVAIATGDRGPGRSHVRGRPSAARPDRPGRHSGYSWRQRWSCCSARANQRQRTILGLRA